MPIACRKCGGLQLSHKQVEGIQAKYCGGCGFATITIVGDRWLDSIMALDHTWTVKGLIVIHDFEAEVAA